MKKLKQPALFLLGCACLVAALVFIGLLAKVAILALTFGYNLL